MPVLMWINFAYFLINMSSFHNALGAYNIGLISCVVDELGELNQLANLIQVS